MKAIPATLFALADSVLFVAWQAYLVGAQHHLHLLRHTGDLPWPCEPYELRGPQR